MFPSGNVWILIIVTTCTYSSFIGYYNNISVTLWHLRTYKHYNNWSQADRIPARCRYHCIITVTCIYCQVIFKSCKLVPVMIGGILIQGNFTLRTFFFLRVNSFLHFYTSVGSPNTVLSSSFFFSHVFCPPIFGTHKFYHTHTHTHSLSLFL